MAVGTKHPRMVKAAAWAALSVTAALAPLWSCAGATPSEPAVVSPPAAPLRHAPRTPLAASSLPGPPVAPVASAAETRAAPAPTPDEPAKPSPCPSDMKLVDGDYCTEVSHKCLRSWYAKENRKVVCEAFEPLSRCVGRREHKRFCIDTYEYPNRAGERPEIGNDYYQAQVKCAALGRRLCTESEWSFACEGPEMKPFPYGYARDTTACNGDRPYGFPDVAKLRRRDPAELERLWQGVPSGSQPRCVSDFGVADMPGNADELASSEHEWGWQGKFDSVTTGGPWYKGVRNQCRPKIYTHDESFWYYYLSFRCCAEADGAPTDPRSPKQLKRRWNFQRVERLAGLTVQQAKAEMGR